MLHMQGLQFNAQELETAGCIEPKLGDLAGNAWLGK